MIPYRTVVADPPWPYKTLGQIGKTLSHRPNRDKGLSKHGAGSVVRYGAMPIEELKMLSFPKDDNAHLYLWVTNTFIEQAYAVSRVWGFRPVTLLTWTKIKSDMTPSMKMGYYFRGATEHCLFSVRGSLRLLKKNVSTALLSKRLPHSAKPECFMDMVEQVSPGPYLELFARKKRLGWDSWGNEVITDIEVKTMVLGNKQEKKCE